MKPARHMQIAGKHVKSDDRTATPVGSQKLNANVLIVEDTRVHVAQLTDVLEEEGCSIRVATNGVEALDLLQADRPDVVISDIVMPKMDGYELCRRIKRDPTLAKIPVVLVTSLTDPEDVLKGLECGADNLVPKPFKRAYLVSRIRQSLESRLRENENSMGGVMIDFAGRDYYITAGRLQIINLLLSTYATAVQKSAELQESNRELVRAQTTLAQQAEQLHELSLRDALTGLFNRRGFTTLAEHELKLAERTGTSLLLFYLDVDNMKDINDGCGHAEGDRALVDLGEILRDAFREADIITRLGGDEFVVLEIDASPEDVDTFARRLRERLEASDARRDRPYRIALSVVVASFDPQNPMPLEDLVHVADTAMYHDKKSKNGYRRNTLA